MGILFITFVSGTGVEATATQGWNVKIGDEQPINVYASNIGTTLFQGEFRVETHLDASGNLSPHSVCVGFPKVEASRNIDDNDNYSLKLRLEKDTCRIVVDDVRRTDIPDTMARTASESHEEHWGRAVVKAGEVPFFPAVGFALTQSKVMIDYASSLSVYGSSHRCEVQSPAAFVGIRWYKKSCVASPITHHGTYVKTKTTGEFYARRDGDIWGESIHSSSAEIEGYSTQYVITCRWWPSSIENLNWGILNVNLECHSDES